MTLTFEIWPLPPSNHVYTTLHPTMISCIKFSEVSKRIRKVVVTQKTFLLKNLLEQMNGQTLKVKDKAYTGLETEQNAKTGHFHVWESFCFYGWTIRDVEMFTPRIHCVYILLLIWYLFDIFACEHFCAKTTRNNSENVLTTNISILWKVSTVKSKT